MFIVLVAIKNIVGVIQGLNIVKNDKNYLQNNKKYNEIDFKPVSFFVNPLSGVGCLYIVRTSISIVLFTIYNIFWVIQGLQIVKKDKNYPKNTKRYK